MESQVVIAAGTQVLFIAEIFYPSVFRSEFAANPLGAVRRGVI